MSRRALFVVDSSPAAGLGHVVRSSALASALTEVGVDACFLVESHPAVLGKLAAARLPVLNRAWDGTVDVPTVAEAVHVSGCDVIVIDSYQNCTAVFDSVAQAGIVTVAIDDLAREPFSCDVVINGGAQARRLDYRSVSTDTTFLLGPGFALLRPQFWVASAEPEIRPSVERILVTLGGSASPHVFHTVIDALDRVPENFELVVLRGPFSDRLDAAARQQAHVTRVVDDPANIRDLMEQADVAVCSGGQTIYELSAVGTPAVAVELADNQHDSLMAMADEGAVLVAGIGPGAATLAALERIVTGLCSQPDRRLAMSRAGRRLIDGNGARRAAAMIVDLLKRRTTAAVAEARPR